MTSLSRREFLVRSTALAGGAVAPGLALARKAEPVFKISLAQWSLHRAFFGQKGVKKLDALRFAELAKKDYGIEAVEYVNQFYKD